MLVFSAALWFLTLEVFSLAVFPVAFRAFSRMPDRGYAFAKPLGLLSVGFLAGLIGMTRTVPNSNLTVLAAGVAVVAISVLAGRRWWSEIGNFLWSNRRLVIVTEMVFAVVFLGMALLRAMVPDISTTEQPMDLMFLSSTVASTYYPPIDAWFAGEQVSYYYLGYLLIGSVALLTNTVTPVAYSLGLATYAAMGAVAAFGLTFNLVRLSRGPAVTGALAGAASVFLLLVASNLLGVLELAWASGAGSKSFWEWITPDPNWFANVQAAVSWRQDELWWWWRASRAVPNAITEFPAFSFLLGDMHPHVMSIGFIIVTVGVAVQIYLRPGLIQRDTLRRHFPLFMVTVLSVGGMGAINLWDLPLGLTLVSGAVLLNAARNERRVQFGRSLAFTDRFLIIGLSSGAARGDRPERRLAVRAARQQVAPRPQHRGARAGGGLGLRRIRCGPRNHGGGRRAARGAERPRAALLLRERTLEARCDAQARGRRGRRGLRPVPWRYTTTQSWWRRWRRYTCTAARSPSGRSQRSSTPPWRTRCPQRWRSKAT